MMGRPVAETEKAMSPWGQNTASGHSACRINQPQKYPPGPIHDDYRTPGALKNQNIFREDSTRQKESSSSLKPPISSDEYYFQQKVSLSSAYFVIAHDANNLHNIATLGHMAPRCFFGCDLFPPISVSLPQGLYYTVLSYSGIRYLRYLQTPIGLPRGLGIVPIVRSKLRSKLISIDPN